MDLYQLVYSEQQINVWVRYTALNTSINIISKCLQRSSGRISQTFETLRWFKSGSSDDEIVTIFACAKCQYNFHEIGVG